MHNGFDMALPCNPGGKTLCDGDCSNNVWYVEGKCLLDQLTYDQVYFVLQRNPKAKPDLLRATTDPTLLQLANESRLIADDLEDDLIPYRMINNPAQTLPYYTLFKGKTPGGAI